MKNKFSCGTDLALETSHGNFEYKKGDFIDFRIDQDGDPFIVHHYLAPKESREGDKAWTKDGREGTLKTESGKLVLEVQGGYFRDYNVLGKEVKSTAVAITTERELRTLLSNVVLAEEISSKVDLQKISLTDLIISEGYSVNDVAKYLSESYNPESSSPDNLKEAVKGMAAVVDSNTINVPVHRRLEKKTVPDRLKKLSENLYQYKDNEFSIARLTGIAVSGNSVDMSGYVIARENLKNPKLLERKSEAPFRSFFYSTPGLDFSKIKFEEEFSVSPETQKLDEEGLEGEVCTTADGQHGFIAYNGGACVCVVDPDADMPHAGEKNPAGATGDIGGENPPQADGSANAPAVSDPATGFDFPRSNHVPAGAQNSSVDVLPVSLFPVRENLSRYGYSHERSVPTLGGGRFLNHYFLSKGNRVLVQNEKANPSRISLVEHQGAGGDKLKFDSIDNLYKHLLGRKSK